ncbi:MAG: tetratricopeptide repeat protein, partial [Thermoflexibacteraceae bacterium]
MSPQKDNKAVEYAKILYQFGKLYEKSYLYQNAVPLFEECVKLRNAELGEEHPEYLSAVNHLATVYQHLQLYDKAEPYFKEYITALNKDILRKFPSLSDKQKAVFYDAMKPNIENFMRYAINRVGLNPYVKVPSYKHSPAILGDLYDLQLATKAILLNAGSNTRQKILSSQDTALIRKYKKWVNCKEKLAQVAMVKRQDIGKLGVNVDSLHTTANSLEKELTLLSGDFAGGYASSQLPTWRDIQAKLKAQEAAVEIIQIPYKKDTTFYVALIVKQDTKEHPEVVFWANGHDLNNKLLKTYRNAVLYQSFEKGGYLHYWKPIADKLKGIQKVYVSPDGAYHQISLLTLWNDEAQRFLLDEIQIALLTNTKD